MPPRRTPKTLAVRAARAAADKQGTDILVLQVEHLISICDYFVLVSGDSPRQLKAIAEAVEEELRSAGIKPLRREGAGGGELRWLLLDFADIVVHIFDEQTRSYYELERLWKDAPVIVWEKKAGATRVPGRRARGGSQR